MSKDAYVPFHPCGSGMDVLRFTYKSLMRFGEGMPPTLVRWFQVPNDSPIGSNGRGFTSRIWESDWRLKTDRGEVGELYGQKPIWYDGLPQPVGLCNKGPYWPEKYQRGVPREDQGSFPALVLDDQGFPVGCCAEATFYNLYYACFSLYRWPRKIRLKAVHHTGPGWCAEAIDTDIVIELNAFGFWEGEGFWEPGHFRVRASYLDPSEPFAPCRVRFDFLDHPGAVVFFQLAQNIHDVGWLEDAYGVYLLGPTHIFFPDAWRPCLGGVTQQQVEWKMIAELEDP